MRQDKPLAYREHHWEPGARNCYGIGARIKLVTAAGEQFAMVSTGQPAISRPATSAFTSAGSKHNAVNLRFAGQAAR